MVLKFLPLAALFFASCVSIERNNPDDPKSTRFGEKNNPSVVSGLCGDFVDGTEREHYGQYKAQFCDARDGKKYVYVEIGNQTWMAENLNYNASGSKCYNGQDYYCNTYGRLYNWATANTVCPDGWRLPSNDDWRTLLNFFNTSCLGTNNCPYVGTNLKANNGWDDNNGSDDKGFSALPGGTGVDETFTYAGNLGRWWSSSDYNASEAYNLIVFADDNTARWSYNGKSNFFISVRCLHEN